MSGITHDELDLSVDTLRAVTIPLLQNFGIYNVNFHIKKRGVPPKGGGLVELSIPIMRGSLQSVYLVDEGFIKRVRGVAFCTRISPTIITRVIDSCRGVLNDYLPDVHISTDHFKGGKDGGDSPGYSVSLVAETTTGALLSIERTAKPRRERTIPGIAGDSAMVANAVDRDAPEDVGREAASMLLEEIFSGGVIDRAHQSLILQLMVLTPEDVSKVSREGAKGVSGVGCTDQSDLGCVVVVGAVRNTDRASDGNSPYPERCVWRGLPSARGQGVLASGAIVDETDQCGRFQRRQRRGRRRVGRRRR